MNFFDRANRWINNAENSAVNFFSAVAPWLAPLVPMQITVSHMTDYLEFPRWVAWTTGLVVEILGLAAVSTIMRLWRHNQVMRANKDKQPLWIPIAVYVFYLTVILVVIALPELAKTRQDWIAVTVKIMLSMLSVPAVITLAIRAQNTEIVQERQTKRSGKKNLKHSAELPETYRKLTAEFSDWRTLPRHDKAQVSEMSTAEIVQVYGVTERTARNWRNKSNQNGNAHQRAHK